MNIRYKYLCIVLGLFLMLTIVGAGCSATRTDMSKNIENEIRDLVHEYYTNLVEGNYDKALNRNSIANAISKILYPNDNHLQGKSLRLRQQYFMCAASIGDIVNNHMNVYGTLDNLHEKVAIHINDTHPTLAIPELMRILLDDCGYTWEDAWNIVTKTFAYTNHTVMPEALEKWDLNLVKEVIPRIFSIIVEINNRYCRELMERNGRAHV